MTIAIDADCALAYWMLPEATRRLKRRPSQETLSERIRAGSLPSWAYDPNGHVHVIATTRRERIRQEKVCCRLSLAELGSDSFVFTETGIPVVSPECCFVRLAGILSFHELVKVGNLLCASFAIDEAGCLMSRGAAITTKNRIAAYVDSVHDANGIKTARKAVRFIADNAASPAEVDACLLLCLPVMRGGFACPMPEFNGHVGLRPEVARTLGYFDCYCDLIWRGAKCVVEYTSELHHTGYEKQARDEMRRAALESMGYRVYLLTKTQMQGQAAFEGIARPVLKAHGKRMPRRTLEALGRQHALRRDLLFKPSWILRHACRM